MFHAIFKSRRGSLEIHSVKFGIGSSLLDNLDRNSMEHISFIRIIYYECSVVFEHCVFPETVFFFIYSDFVHCAPNVLFRDASRISVVTFRSTRVEFTYKCLSKNN